jgi:hypothetical protein
VKKLKTSHNNNWKGFIGSSQKYHKSISNRVGVDWAVGSTRITQDFTHFGFSKKYPIGILGSSRPQTYPKWIYILSLCRSNDETDPIQSNTILDWFFDTRYWIALAIQPRGIRLNECLLRLGAYCDPNPIPKGCGLCVYWVLDWNKPSYQVLGSDCSLWYQCSNKLGLDWRLIWSQYLVLGLVLIQSLTDTNTGIRSLTSLAGGTWTNWSRPA